MCTNPIDEILWQYHDLPWHWADSLHVCNTTVQTAQRAAVPQAHYSDKWNHTWQELPFLLWHKDQGCHATGWAQMVSKISTWFTCCFTAVSMRRDLFPAFSGCQAATTPHSPFHWKGPISQQSLLTIWNGLKGGEAPANNESPFDCNSKSTVLTFEWFQVLAEKKMYVFCKDEATIQCDMFWFRNSIESVQTLWIKQIKLKK